MTPVQRHKSGGFEAEVQGMTHSNRKRGGWAYLVLWEFQVRAGMEKRFVKGYGPDGDWARLFAQDKSYIGTELIHNLKGGRTYVTLDFWTSQEAYNEFRKQQLAKYKTLDQKCEDLTESEREIGRFVRVSNK
jgi:heme-degrading monooxygenase HmoA